jgi:hypothetical protein
MSQPVNGSRATKVRDGDTIVNWPRAALGPAPRIARPPTRNGHQPASGPSAHLNAQTPAAAHASPNRVGSGTYLETYRPEREGPRKYSWALWTIALTIALEMAVSYWLLSKPKPSEEPAPICYPPACENYPRDAP